MPHMVNLLRATKFIGDGSGLTNLPSGGGSGTVTSVAVTGSDGIEVDSGSPITTSGTIALGVNATNLRSHINVANGATAITQEQSPSVATGTGLLLVEVLSPSTGTEEFLGQTTATFIQPSQQVLIQVPI